MWQRYEPRWQQIEESTQAVIIAAILDGDGWARYALKRESTDGVHAFGTQGIRWRYGIVLRMVMRQRYPAIEIAVDGNMDAISTVLFHEIYTIAVASDWQAYMGSKRRGAEIECPHCHRVMRCT